MTPHTPPPDPPVEVGHETRDVRIRPVLWLAGAVVVVAALTHTGLWFLQEGLEKTARQQDPELSPLTETDRKPPEPRLQSAPIQDYDDFLAEQERTLESYGWVDKEQKIVRIPVSRAMDLLMERGLPAPKGDEERKDAPEENSSEVEEKSDEGNREPLE